MSIEDDRLHLSPDGVSARKAATVKGHSLARRLMATPARRRANAEVDWHAWIADIEDEARAPSVAPAPASVDLGPFIAQAVRKGSPFADWAYLVGVVAKERDDALDELANCRAAVRDAHALREERIARAVAILRNRLGYDADADSLIEEWRAALSATEPGPVEDAWADATRQILREPAAGEREP